MRLLVLGGTKFLGRATVDAALARGHEVTLFNRGQTNPELFPDVEKIRGDRTEDLGALAGREWDAALDMATFLPRVVRLSVEALPVALPQAKVGGGAADERVPVTALEFGTEAIFRALQRF